jgi:hypothetical protein
MGNKDSSTAWSRLGHTSPLAGRASSRALGERKSNRDFMANADPKPPKKKIRLALGLLWAGTTHLER